MKPLLVNWACLRSGLFAGRIMDISVRLTVFSVWNWPRSGACSRMESGGHRRRRQWLFLECHLFALEAKANDPIHHGWRNFVQMVGDRYRSLTRAHELGRFSTICHCASRNGVPRIWRMCQPQPGRSPALRSPVVFQSSIGSRCAQVPYGLRSPPLHGAAQLTCVALAVPAGGVSSGPLARKFDRRPESVRAWHKLQGPCPTAIPFSCRGRREQGN